MIIADAVQALSYAFLVEVLSPVPCSKRFDGAFFGFDVPLNFPPTSSIRFNLLGGDRDKIVTEKINQAMSLQDRIHCFDWSHAGEIKHFFDFWCLTVLFQ